jgi:hypothetical protein
VRAKRTRLQKEQADSWAREIAPLLCALRDRGESVSGIVQYLSIYGILTFKGQPEWCRRQVERTFDRIGEKRPPPRVTHTSKSERAKRAEKLSLAVLLT